MTPHEQRAAQHAARVRMAKFDRQSPEVRAILNYGKRCPHIPNRPLSIKEARSLANGARRP